MNSDINLFWAALGVGMFGIFYLHWRYGPILDDIIVDERDE